jgi:hypothetical protein
LRKLHQRAQSHYRSQRQGRPVPHPLFRLRDGRVEEWEAR